MTSVVVWDGIEFLTVSQEKAEELISQDKAQLVDNNFNHLEAKFRHQFEGYNTAVIESKKKAKSKEA